MKLYLSLFPINAGKMTVVWRFILHCVVYPSSVPLTGTSECLQVSCMGVVLPQSELADKIQPSFGYLI